MTILIAIRASRSFIFDFIIFIQYKTDFFIHELHNSHNAIKLSLAHFPPFFGFTI